MMASRGQRRTSDAAGEVDENENTRTHNQGTNANDIEQQREQHPPRGSDGGSRRSSQNPRRTTIIYSAPRSHTGRPSQAEEERFRICIILIASWLFMAVAGLFLVCYIYLLEWSPETADPIHIFSLEFAVCMLYVMFIVDIFASIAIIVAHKEYAKPFRFRVFWPAVGFLCLNHIHGTFVGFWVWTGEFPRSCSQNSFYLGRRCQNLANILITNTDGKLRLTDCKCDYGACLPECKGLRLIQHYFWCTFWLYVIRTAMLIICIPWLRKAICECKWCCCIDPRDGAAVQPSNNDSNSLHDPDLMSRAYCPYDECCCPHHRHNLCDHSCHRENGSQCSITSQRKNACHLQNNNEKSRKRPSDINDDAKALGFKEKAFKEKRDESSTQSTEMKDESVETAHKWKPKPCKVSEGTDVQHSFYKCPNAS